jgi:hypothetical protein
MALLLAGKPFASVAKPLVDGPPPGVSGGFGEETCRKCHFDFELNDPSGSLRVDGLPDAYFPGKEYVLTVRLTHPQMERGGYELAARFAGGEPAGRQSGALSSSDPRSRIVTDSIKNVQYALQSREGSAVERKGATAWEIRWKAPENPAAAVVFHVAANAANYDDSPLGDYPYASSVTVPVAPTVVR